jgi:hypothetical protein
MIALNKGDNPVRIDPLLYTEMLAGVVTGTDVLTGKSGRISEWTIPGKSPVVLECKDR